MTGLGEPVYVEKNEAVAEMVENAARERQRMVVEQYGRCMVPITNWDSLNEVAKNAHLVSQRAALESLGIPLTVLAALRSGEWVAAPRQSTKEMLEQAEEMYMPFGEMLAAWDGFLMGAPKEP